MPLSEPPQILFQKKSTGYLETKGITAGFMHEATSKPLPPRPGEALREPTVFVDIDKVVEYSVEEQNSSEYDYVFVVDNLVEDIVDVEFQVEWRHGVVDGARFERSIDGRCALAKNQRHRVHRISRGVDRSAVRQR